MTEADRAIAQLPDFFDEACERLNVDRPAFLEMNILPDTDEPGWSWLEIKPDSLSDVSPHEHRTLGAWSVALCQFGLSNRKVVFPAPQDMPKDRVLAQVDADTLKQIQILL